MTDAAERYVTRDTRRRIARVYYSGEPGGLGSKTAFIKAHPYFPRHQVDLFFAEDPQTQRFYGKSPYRKRSEQTQIAYFPGQRVQLDLASFQNQAGPWTWLLVAICNYSNFAWVVPLPDKTAAAVSKALESLMRESFQPIRPFNVSHTVFLCDRGREFDNALVASLLQSSETFFMAFLRSSVQKASSAEKLIWIIRRKLKLLMDHVNQPWHTYLDRVLTSYNGTKQQVLGNFSPKEVITNHPGYKTWLRAKRGSITTESVTSAMTEAVRAAGLYPQDFVKIGHKKKIFEKGSITPRVSQQLFQITHLKLPNLSAPNRFPMYRLRNLMGESMPPLFRRPDLVRLDPSSSSHPLHPDFRATLDRVFKAPSPKSPWYRVSLIGPFGLSFSAPSFFHPFHQFILFFISFHFRISSPPPI